MTVDDWLIASKLDAEKRGLAAVGPVLETLAIAIAALRAEKPDPIVTSEARSESESTS